MFAILIALGSIFIINKIGNQETVTNFIECEKEGNPIMESYPRQCRDKTGRLFVEEI